jgi:hypothetical protein
MQSFLLFSTELEGFLIMQGTLKIIIKTDLTNTQIKPHKTHK